jgi:hypothetical protein
VARPGGVGAYLAHFSGRLGPTREVGLEQGFPGWQLRPRQKGGEDIAYGWKGKGSTVHLLTEGNGLPLAFLVSAANVAEVTVGLKAVDRVRVPRPKGRPKKRLASLGADKGYDSADFRHGLRRRGVQPSIPRREWRNRRRRSGRPPETHEAQQVALEGRAESWLAGQLAPIGYSVRLVYPKLCCLSDHRLFYDCPVKDFGLEDFWDWFMKSS